MNTMEVISDTEADEVFGGGIWIPAAVAVATYWVTENWSDIKQGATDAFKDAFKLN